MNSINQQILNYFLAKKTNNNKILSDVLIKGDDIWLNKGFISQLKSIEKYLINNSLLYLLDLDWEVLNSKEMVENLSEASLHEIYIRKNILDEKYKEALFFFKKENNYSLDIQKSICICFFKLKKHIDCLVLAESILKQNNDYYIAELAAECYLVFNEIKKAYEYFALAIKLNSKLVSAKFKYHTLAVQLGYKITQEELDDLESVALKRKNNSWIRTVAYIQYKFKNYEKCIMNLAVIEKNLTVPFYSIDYLTLSECYFYLGDVELSQETLNKAKQKSYKYEIEKIGGDNLLVTFSPANNFMLKKYDCESDRLNIVDNSYTYYLHSAQFIVEKIIEIQSENQYKKISLVGNSKGGCGALLVSNLLRERLSEAVTIKAILFSPQTKLWPYNDNLKKIPSYRELVKLAHINLKIHDILDQKGQLYKLKTDYRNYVIHCFYGNGFDMDVNEVKSIKELPNVNLIELKYSGHGTSIPLTIPEGKTYEDLKKTYSKLKIDDDFKELGGNHLVDIVDEIYEIYKDPQMRLSKYI